MQAATLPACLLACLPACCSLAPWLPGCLLQPAAVAGRLHPPSVVCFLRSQLLLLSWTLGCPCHSPTFDEIDVVQYESTVVVWELVRTLLESCSSVRPAPSLPRPRPLPRIAAGLERRPDDTQPPQTAILNLWSLPRRSPLSCCQPAPAAAPCQTLPPIAYQQRQRPVTGRPQTTITNGSQLRRVVRSRPRTARVATF